MPLQDPPLWYLESLHKSFHVVKALQNVSLTLKAGEVHALLGENGSGKSTLVKCLAGVHQPDKGSMYHQGHAVTLHHPIDARVHGVATIFQEFSLVTPLSVAENIFLGRQPRKPGGLIDWGRMRALAETTLARLDIHLDPDAIVRHLSVAEQQLVEIAKAISLDSSLLILDEPTAALGLAETERLLNLIRQLAEGGKAILYISHRLDEVFKVADIVTVLKDGQLVTTQPISSLRMNDAIRLMVGQDIEQHYPKIHNAKPRPCLEVKGLSTNNGVKQVSFTINVGEVFGLGGMVGAGRTQIARALFGLDRWTSGSVRLHGAPLEPKSPSDAIAVGIGLVPENRKVDGLFFNFAAPQNITMPSLRRILNGPFIDLAREWQTGLDFVDRLHITPTAMEKTVKYLSGGTMQKVVVARWLFSQAKLLILDEPTQGIDVGAKVDVYNVINELTAQGISVLLISSDYPELLALSDRIAIVRDGRILATFSAQELTEHRLIAIASGATPEKDIVSGATPEGEIAVISSTGT